MSSHLPAALFIHTRIVEESVRGKSRRRMLRGGGRRGASSDHVRSDTGPSRPDSGRAGGVTVARCVEPQSASATLWCMETRHAVILAWFVARKQTGSCASPR